MSCQRLAVAGSRSAATVPRGSCGPWSRGATFRNAAAGAAMEPATRHRSEDLMGRIRKTLSICTFGLIRFRNEREKTYRAVRKSNKIAKQQLRNDRQPQQPPQA